MKKIALGIVVVLLFSIMISCFVGCSTLSAEDGIKALKEAYNNTKENYNDIYQYSEKIYKKGTLEKEGYIINRKVNVICNVNKKYELEKDKDYAINIREEKFSETIDESSKLTTKNIGSNEIWAGKGSFVGEKDKSLDVLAVSSWKGEEGENSIQKEVNAKDFYNSKFFDDYRLMNKQVMVELETIINHPEYINYEVEKGGIKRKGKVVDYNFKVSEDYLKEYKEKNGIESRLIGKRVWLQISYDRISNIYVYSEEDLGGKMNVDYESYTFVITYVGPKITNIPAFPKEGEKSNYQEKFMFDGNKFQNVKFQDIEK